MSEADEPKPGVWASLKRMLEALLATAQNRIELFTVELQEEKRRMVEALLWAAALAAFGMMTLSLVTFTIVVLCWDNGRMLALAVLIVLHFVGTVVAWQALQSRLNSKSAFTDTLAEIKKDRSCLETDNPP